MALDDADIVRILEYVGRDSVSDTLDRSELRKDILAAWDFYQGYKRTTKKGPRTLRRKYAETVSLRADELFDLLTDSEVNATAVRSAMSQNLSGAHAESPDAESPLVSLTYGLKKLATAARATQRKYSGITPMREILDVTPTEWFLGHDLASVYENHFNRPATRTRENGGSLEGPFIRFVIAVTAKLGEPFTDETVSKAMTALRKWPASKLES
jgi:hypothetical protein